MAALYDKYDLSASSLQPWFHTQLKGRFPSNSADFEEAARSIPTVDAMETMKLAYLTDDAAIFARATVFCVYSASVFGIRFHTQVAFRGEPVVGTLVGKIPHSSAMIHSNEVTLQTDSKPC